MSDSRADLLGLLGRREVITTDPREAEECCGLPRDDDGFCIHRPGHPIYVRGELGVGALLAAAWREGFIHADDGGWKEENPYLPETP